MSLLPYIAGIALLVLAVAGLMLGRRRIRSSAGIGVKVSAAAAAAAVAMLFGPGVAAAAADGQPRLIPTWKQSHFEEGDPTVRSIYILAVCTRNHRREAAVALLDSRPGSLEEGSLVRAALPSGKTECPIPAEKLKLNNWVLVRGAIAEAIYNGDRRRPRTETLPLAETFTGSDRVSTSAVARWVARCAVRRKPLLAHSVVRFNPGAIGEERALRALKATFTGCLPAGRRLEVSRLGIRALIAQELYRASVSFKESFANAHG